MSKKRYVGLLNFVPSLISFLKEYTDKQDFMRKYNSPDYWEDYSFSNGILYVDGFSSKITFGDNSFSYTDGDGKTQTFNRWNGTIESLFE